MRLGQVAVQFERLSAGRQGVLNVCPVGVIIHLDHGITVGQPAVRQRKTGVPDNRAGKHVSRVLQAFLAQAEMLAGEWPRQKSMGNETGEKTLGLIGFGGIARETAARAQALGMRVIAFDPYLPADNPIGKLIRPVGDIGPA